MAIPIPLLAAGGGAALNLLGGIGVGGAGAKEQKRMRQFLERIYSEYVNNPLYTQTRDFALELLKTGDYQNIFHGALQTALARNRANLLNAQNQMQAAAARGGFLRGGQQQDLLSRARDAAFQADRGSVFDVSQQQFGAKQYAAQLSENLAKGPFQAGAQIAPLMYNPKLAMETSPWGPIGDVGSQVGNFGAGLYGQQQGFDLLKGLIK